ncbi:MAG: hypothetical protein U0793_04680 [Gemmataceae bacterium]
MTRLVGTGAVLFSLVLFSGCSSDRREQPIVSVINALNLCSENIKNINAYLKSAEDLKKKADEADEAGKPEAKKNFDRKIEEVQSSIKDLKQQAEKLLVEMRRAEKNPIATTPEEKQDLAKKYKSKVADGLEAISKERAELARTWERVEKTFDEKTFKDLNQKFRQAEGEFENLSRLRS